MTAFSDQQFKAKHNTRSNRIQCISFISVHVDLFAILINMILTVFFFFLRMDNTVQHINYYLVGKINKPEVILFIVVHRDL